MLHAGPPPPVCNCTVQGVFARTCPILSYRDDPCNGTVNGERINSDKAPVCVDIVGSNKTTYAYEPAYCSLLGCNSTLDCELGEVCIGTPNYCPQTDGSYLSLCVVEAVSGNCGRTFNGGPLSSAPTGNWNNKVHVLACFS